MTTPVIRVLKQQLGAEIHFLTKQSFRAVLEANPYIDQLITIQKEASEVLALLKQESYDYIIDLHKNLRSLQIKRALRAKSFAFNKINIQKWLIVNLKINRLPEFHIVDRYLATVHSLGVKNDGKGLDYFIPPEAEVRLEHLLANRQSSYVGFVIGAAHATKRLPQAQISAICKAIEAPIILLGGPGEQEIGNQIAKEAGTQVINACGKFNLNQSASLVRQAALIISHDTGLMHIAAAFRKKIISIWGNTIPEFGMYPYYPDGLNENISFEIEGLSCRPCSKIGYQQCPKSHFNCMQQHDPFQIAALANSIIKKQA